MSKKGNTMFFKQVTLLANFIGYLIAPETDPKTVEKKGRQIPKAQRIRNMEGLGMSLTASPGLVAYEAARQEKKAKRKPPKAKPPKAP